MLEMSPHTTHLLNELRYTTTVMCENYYRITKEIPTATQASVFLKRSIEAIENPTLRTSLRGARVAEVKCVPRQSSFNLSFGFNIKGLKRADRFLRERTNDE